MIYTKVKFILRTTQNLSCVVLVKSKVEISQTCVAFSEYMNFTYSTNSRYYNFCVLSSFFVKKMYFLPSVHRSEPAKQFDSKIMIFDTMEISRRLLTLTLCHCFEVVSTYVVTFAHLLPFMNCLKLPIQIRTDSDFLFEKASSQSLHFHNELIQSKYHINCLPHIFEQKTI